MQRKLGARRQKMGNWIRKHVDVFYWCMVVFTVLGMAFFTFSRNILGDDSDIVDSGVGAKTTTAVGNGTITIVERGVNAKTGYAEVMFQVNQPPEDVDSNFDAVAVDVKANKEIPAKVEQITDQYYVLHINKLDPKWSQLEVDYGLVNKATPETDFDYGTDPDTQGRATNGTKSEVDQQSYSIDYRRVKSNPNLKQRTHKQYVAEYVKIEITDTKKAIAGIQKDRKAARKAIGEYRAKRSKLQKQKQTVVGEDESTIKDSIDSIDDSIEGLNKTIKNGLQAEKNDKKLIKQLRSQTEN